MTRPLSLALLFVLSGSAFAGGESLSGTYSWASLGARLSSCGSPTSVREQLAAQGTLTFQPGGTLSISGTDWTECVSGGTTSDSFNEQGTYTLGVGGTLILDLNPAAPGTDLFHCRIDSTRAILVSEELESGAPEFLIGVRQGGGMSNADLAGTYHLVSSSLQVDLGPNPGAPGNTEDLAVRCSVTEVHCDGAGSFTESGTIQEFGPSSQNIGPIADSGSYSVSSVGTVSAGAGSSGAITPDGAFGFVLSRDTAPFGERFDLALLVRKPGSSPSPTVFHGTWAVGSFENQLLAGPLTRQLQVAATAVVETVGTGSFFGLTGSETKSDAFGGSTSSSQDFGELVTAPDGEVSLFSGVTLSHQGWIDAGGRVMLFGTNQTLGETAMIVCLRVTEPLGRTFCFGDGAGAACPCGNENDGTRDSGRAGCANGSSSGGVALGAAGSASISTGQLALYAEGLGPNLPCLFFQGDNSVNGGNGTPFGGGLRCAGGGVKRLVVRFSDAGGVATTFGVTLWLQGGVGAGATRRYQAWYRDPVPGGSCSSSFNFSNGLELDWLP